MIYFAALRDGDGLPPESFPLPIVPRSAQYVIKGSVLPTPQQIRRAVVNVDPTPTGLDTVNRSTLSMMKRHRSSR